MTRTVPVRAGQGGPEVGKVTDVEFKAYPTGDPLALTGAFSNTAYETTDEDGKRVGVAEHIVAVTGVVDEVGDVFVPGSFIPAMERIKAKGVSGHDWGTKVSKALVREEWLPGDPRIAEKIIPNLPEGKTWPKEAGAVYVKAQYNLETPEGQRAYSNAKFYGADECYSVGYRVRAGGATERKGIRYLKDFDWYEWSDVLHGANSLAFGLSVKGLLDSELEHSGGRLATQAEVKTRYVRDSTFWGLPLGTPIRPGMKPRGPKALRMRREGEIPDPERGTTAKPPTGDPAKDKKAPLAKPGKPDPALFDEPERQTVRATRTQPVDAYSDDTIAEIVDDLAGARTVGQRPKGVEERDAEIESLLDEGLTPDEVGDLLRNSENWGADGPNEDAIDEFVSGYSEEYQRRAREQRNVGTPPGVDKPKPASRDEAIYQARKKADSAYARDDTVALAEALAVLFEGDSNAPDVDEEAERISIMSQGRALDILDDHTSAARERAGIGLNPNEKTEDDKLRRAEFDQAAGDTPDTAARNEKPAPEPESPPAKPDDDLQKRMDALKAEGRDNEAAKLYADERRARRRADKPAVGLAEKPDGGVEDPVDQRIFDALGQLLPAPGEWARLSDLRAQLADVDRAELDTRLKKLGRDQQITLAPDPSGRNISSEDRDAAITVGGDENHLITTDKLPERDTTADLGADESEQDLGADEPIGADELIGAEELDAAAALTDDGLGLIEADDGEFEVTPEVAERQDRVEALLEQGDTAVTDLDDTQLTDARRDVADELALQEEIARRDATSRRGRQTPPSTDEPAETPASVDAGRPAGEGEDETAGSEPAAEAAPAGPKVRPGLAGAAEDLADALDDGDEDAIARARTRLESSLRRSRSESEQAQTLRDLLASGDDISADQLRSAATAMRDEARTRRNEQARGRRLAKRLERERLRSLLGQIDAEMRTRGLSTPGENENPEGDKIGPTDADATGVLTPEDLAAAQALTEPDEPPAPEPAGDQPVPPESPATAPEQPPAPKAAPELEPVTEIAEITGLPAGQWTDSSVSPMRVAGPFYEAAIEPSTTRPGEFEYSFRVTSPDGDIAGIGSGRADSIADAQRFVVGDIAETLRGPSFPGGVGTGVQLPDAPPEPSETERAETIYSETALKRQGRDDINPITGAQDFTVAPTLADKPAGTRPFATVEEVQDHLGDTFLGTGGAQWDTAMLSPGGGLVALRVQGKSGFTITHTGTGLALTSHNSNLGQRDARDLMVTLERMLGPNGRQVDWTAPTDKQVRDSIAAAGFSLNDYLPAANAAVVARRIAAGDYSSKLVKDSARIAAPSSWSLRTKFPNWDTGNKRLTNNQGGLALLLNNGRAKPSDSRSAEEIADDRATLAAANGAENLLNLGAPDKAIAVIERRADELEAKYGRGASPYDVTTGGASARGSVMLRRMADTMRQMVAVSPQGVDALKSAQPGDRFLIIDQGAVPGNPNMDPKKSYRTFTISGRAASTGSYDSSTAFDAVEDNAPNSVRNGQIRLAINTRGDEPQVEMPRWIEASAGNSARARIADQNGPQYLTLGDTHAYRTTRVVKLAPNEQLPETFDDALNRVGTVTREPHTEAAIAAARRQIDDAAGAIDVDQAPKQRASRTRSTRRAGGRAARPAEVTTPESQVPQAVLDTQQRNTAALIGGPIPLADTAPEGPFASIDEVRRAWAKGVMPDGGPMDPAAAVFARDRAGEDSWWNGMQLSPGGWFLVQPNGQVTHALTSRLVTGRTGGLPTQAAAMRYADMLERVTANGEVIDWSGDGSRAPEMMRAAGLVEGVSIAKRIASRAVIDEGNNPKAVKAVLAGRNLDVSASGVTPILLDTAAWGRAFDPGRADSGYPGYSSERHYLGRKPSVNWPTKEDERKSEELRKLLVWAEAMSTVSPYTVATELRRWQADNQDRTLKFRTTERDGNYDTKVNEHEVRPADIVDEIASKLERAADPSQRSEPEKLAANNGGTVKVSDAHVEVDRLISDSDAAYTARQKQVEQIRQMIISGGAEIRYDSDRRKWVATLPDVIYARPGESSPLEVLTVVPGQATAAEHISDEVVLTNGGGVRLRFRAQPDDPSTYNSSIVRVDVPPGSWTVAGDEVSAGKAAAG